MTAQPDTVPAALRKAWAQVPHMAGKAEPVCYDEAQQCLTVECVDTTWVLQMRVLGSALLTKLNDALPEPFVQAIRITLRPLRVLVTGSRDWDDEPALWDALLDTWHDATQTAGPEHQLVVVHGACPRGADLMAHRWAQMQRFAGERIAPEPHPADWDKHGKRAGFLRNQAMVDLGADICLAFIKNNSRGASHTAERAETVGIAVRRFTA